MLTKQMSDFIQVIPDVLSEEDRKTVLDALSQSSMWVTASANGYEQGTYRSCDTLMISGVPQLKACDTILFTAAGKALQNYVDAVQSQVSIQKDTGYEALRYTEGGFYKTHVDHYTGKHRTLTCAFTINDDYEGGEWGFFGEELVLTPKPGSAVLFPSNFCFPHQILPVTKGTRYSVVTWFV